MSLLGSSVGPIDIPNIHTHARACVYKISKLLIFLSKFVSPQIFPISVNGTLVHQFARPKMLESFLISPFLQLLPNFASLPLTCVSNLCPSLHLPCHLIVQGTIISFWA